MKDGALTTTLKSALQETEEIIFNVVEGLLEKTRISAKEVSAFEVMMYSCQR